MSPKKIDVQIILDAAAKEFAELGFEGARIDSIAKRAGINKAMLYYRIGGKEELYRRVILRGQSTFQQTVLHAVKTSKTAPETILSMLSGISECATKNKLIPSIMLREIAGNAKTLPKEAKLGLNKLMNTFKAMVFMGLEEDSLQEISPITLQYLMIGTIFSLTLTADLRLRINPDDPGPLTTEEITKSITNILLHGILKEGIK